MSNRKWPKYPPGLPIPNTDNPREICDEFPPLEKPSSTPSPPFVPSSQVERLKNDRWHGIGNALQSGVYHYRKRKKQPVLSCGMICFYCDGTKPAKDDIRMLLVCRKDSMSYVEFVRGKYKPGDPLYVRSLIRGMTGVEHTKILTKSFYEIWTEMWVTRSIHTHKQEYNKSKRRYDECIDIVKDYIRTLTDANMEPEWTFPKGRPHRGETDIDCAKREFQEETGIPSERLNMISDMPLREVYTGSNGIVYETHLFVATVDVACPRIDHTNLEQITEVSNIAWVPLGDVSRKMRTTYLSKEVILREAIEQFLMKC